MGRAECGLLHPGAGHSSRQSRLPHAQQGCKSVRWECDLHACIHTCVQPFVSRHQWALCINNPIHELVISTTDMSNDHHASVLLNE